MITRWLHFNKPYDEKIEDIIHSHKDASMKEENPTLAETAETENIHDVMSKSELNVERKEEH